MTGLMDYDFEKDEKLSERRKVACRKNYEAMDLQDLDHLFMSSHKYSKESGLPLYKKPRSIHELCYLNMQRNYDLLANIRALEEYVAELSCKLMKMADDKERLG